MSRIVIFANGDLNQPDHLRGHLRPDDRIFCADGGTVHAVALGLTPEIIIGDLDSLPPELAVEMEARGVNIQRHPRHKDQTDLELALDLAAAHQPDEIMLVTALGGRLDQMLGNILLLTRPAYAPIRLTLADGSQRAILLRSHTQTTITGQAGDTLSLIPLTPSVSEVMLSGVGWPLTQAALSLGSTLSISNQLTGPEAIIQIGDGLALLIHIKN
jgi:thiamine pyrophosphokinase